MAKGMHKPKSLKKRQEAYEANSRSASGQAMRKPGSLKK